MVSYAASSKTEEGKVSSLREGSLCSVKKLKDLTVFLSSRWMKELPGKRSTDKLPVNAMN
jgi:hypothetical protein